MGNRLSLAVAFAAFGLGLLAGSLSLVFADGPWSALMVALAGGLMVGAGFLGAEQVRQVSERKEIAADTSFTLKTLTSHAEAALITLPPALGLAVNEAQSTAGLRRMWTEIGKRKDSGPEALTLEAWDCLERFYGRLSDFFDAMLNSLLRDRDGRSVEALLELWQLRREHVQKGRQIWRPGLGPAEVAVGVIGNLTKDAAPRAAYLGVTVRFLESYTELIRAIEKRKSGRPSRRVG